MASTFRGTFANFLHFMGDVVDTGGAEEGGLCGETGLVTVRQLEAAAWPPTIPSPCPLLLSCAGMQRLSPVVGNPLQEQLRMATASMTTETLRLPLSLDSDPKPSRPSPNNLWTGRISNCFPECRSLLDSSTLWDWLKVPLAICGLHPRVAPAI